MRDVRIRRTSRHLLALGSLVVVVAVGSGASLAASPARTVDPEFTQPGRYDGDGPTIRGFAVADFTGDHRADIAVANINGYLDGHGVPVLIGNGDGTFADPVITPLDEGESPLAMAAADFDRDGNVDLAVSTIKGSTYTLRILLGKGDGTFSPGSKLPDARGAVATGDFNDDGKADLAYVSSRNFSGILAVALGKGDGTFHHAVVSGPSVDENMQRLDARDVTGDEIADLVYQDGSPVVRVGTGDGTFGSAIYSTDDQHRLLGMTFTLDDLTGDGNVDMAIGDATGGHVTIARGTGDGHFTFLHQYADLAYEVISVASADFTGDGKVDLVTSGDPNFQGIEGELVLMKGRGDGSFTRFTRYVTGGYALTTARLNRDKRPDLVSTDLISTGRVFVTLNDGNGLLHAPKLFRSTGSFETRAVSGDVDADGWPDVVLPDGASIATHLNDHHGGFRDAVRSLGQQAFYSMVLADVSADGLPDLIEGSTGSANILVRLGIGDGTFDPAVGYDNGGSGNAVLSLSVADVTGDRVPDVVSYTSSEVSVLPGNGDGSFGPAVLSGAAGGDERATLVGDVTGDKVPDVVAVIRTGNSNVADTVVAVNQGDDSGSFQLVQTVELPTNASAGDIGRLARKAAAAVVVAGSRGSDFGDTGLFVLNNVSGRLDSGTRYDHASDDVRLTDLNGDGRLDAAATCTFDPCPSDGVGLVTYTNLGSGAFSAPHPIYAVFGAPGLTVADFSRDGRPDLVNVIPANPTEFALYTNTTR